MRFVIFTHSLVSDWNHGNAHFLRGVATELVRRGNEVRIFEPRDGWSLRHLLAEHPTAFAEFEHAYPQIRSTLYDLESLDLAAALDGADVVIVHEWNDHALVRRIGEYRARLNGFRLFFHDTHHRSVTDPDSIAAYDLRSYDGVLAYGSVIRDVYRARRWVAQAWTWYEAADTRVFYPRTGEKEGDVVWIGNWGDGERSGEIREFLIRPVRELRLKAAVYGVRYPPNALAELADSGIEYRGWAPNYHVPEVFARYRATIHIPRRPYTRALPGIPTIRPFEALACGIPLISAPWEDSENLFRPGRDFLFAANGEEMIAHLGAVLSNNRLARDCAECGLETIRSRHACSHRVSDLLAIVANVGAVAATEGAH
ncbi:MAG: glycosyltransferase [Terriglobia bacterium]|nr:MAG: glycosyltransferase [Terriglobia bacterium]